MSITCEPHEVRTTPHLPWGPAMDEALRALVEGVNGFVYPGDRVDAICATVRLLRARPDLAAALLTQEDQ